LSEAATKVMRFFDSSKNHQLRVFRENQNQRTIGSGYFKTLRELFGFHEKTTGFYSSRVPRYHENFIWQVSSVGGGGFMKWEQTAGNVPIHLV